MKFFIRTYSGEEMTDKPCEAKNIDEAILTSKVGETIHVCRHEEGLSCTLLK